MRALVAGMISAAYLYGAPGDPQSVLNEVSKLREKYEECRQSQNGNLLEKTKGYQKRISVLEEQIKKESAELKRLKERNAQNEQELTRKKGVIRSLEKTLTSRDEQYRAAAARNEQLSKQAHAVKTAKIERENLTKSLAKAKDEIAHLHKVLEKSSPEKGKKELESAQAQIAKLRTELAAAKSLKSSPQPSAADAVKMKALQQELATANARIVQLQNIPPAVKEKIITKTVEPTEKITALQRELANARSEIANLKSATPKQVVKEKTVEKVVYREKPVTKIVEKVVYKDRIVTQEKVVYKEKPVEKIVYKERPVVQEKVVTKTVEPTEKLNALQSKLVRAESQIAKLKADLAASGAKRPAPVVAAIERVTPRAVKKTSVEPAKTALAEPASKKTGAAAYRMAVDAPVYNAPSGSIVDTWEARRSFTAALPSGGWIRITGYFVNRVWQPTRDDEYLWVRERDVIRR